MIRELLRKRDPERKWNIHGREPHAIQTLALTLAKLKRADVGVRILERAVTIFPGNARVVGFMGVCLVHAGRHEEAVEWLTKALRLDPFQSAGFNEFLGQAHYYSHRFAEAITAFERIVVPPSWVCALLAAAYAMNGQDAPAKDQVSIYERIIEREFEGRLTVEQAMKLTTAKYEVFKRPEDRQLVLDGFGKAGLPV